jgi:energy-coupling factor transporter ATP-binding protein EcfA2
MTQAHGDSFIAMAGVRLRRILSLELFCDNLGPSVGQPVTDMVAACHARWSDLASAISTLPTSIEGAMIITSEGSKIPLPEACTLAVLVLGRGATEALATEACLQAYQKLAPLLITRLDYLSIYPIVDELTLARVILSLGATNCLSISRRLERFELVNGDLERRPPLGFGSDRSEKRRSMRMPEGAAPAVTHLFPWTPSHDDWQGLLEMFLEVPGSTLAIRFQGHSLAPESVRLEARNALHSADALVNGDKLPARSYLAEALRTESLGRVVAVEGPILAMRVFLLSSQQLNEALVTTVINAIDEASGPFRRGDAGALFRGGATILPSNRSHVLAPMAAVELVDCFGPREAAALLRTPMPSTGDMPGLPLERARTAPLAGISGTDVPLGINGFRSRFKPVALDAEMRDRHIYIVGQTGSGKSTLLSNMIVHDILAHRGVVVLDPHGQLVDDVLPHIPQERKGDVIIIDVEDVERPVGFNLLLINEDDPATYRRGRDLILDDLYSYLRRSYNADAFGPIFEMYFRAFMGLLLGAEKPSPGMTPNFSLLRLLFRDKGIRDHLLKQVEAHKDVALEAAIREAEGANGETALKNMAPYITSKFTRFTSDEVLRNLTCQNRMVDLASAIAEQKILLIKLGRGRIGDISAGLLASMVISRLRWAVMKRGAHQGPPVHVYADEFQSFADHRIGELLSEARKFGLRLTLAHQFAAQLPPEVLQAVVGNVGTIIACRVGASDAESLERVFAPTFKRRDLVALPNFQAYVRSLGSLGQSPFSVVLPPPLKGGDKAIAASHITVSRARYGRDLKAIQEEFGAVFERYQLCGMPILPLEKPD